MPTNFDTIRDAKAAAALAVFRATGVTIDLTHGGALTSGLIAGFEKEDESLQAAGVLEERVFLLPRQSGFAGAIDPGDVITSPSGGGTSFSVKRVESDAHEAVYRVVVALSGADSVAGFQIQSAVFAVIPPGGGSPANHSLGTVTTAWLREIADFIPIRAGTLNGPAAQAMVVQGLEVEIAGLDLNDNIAAGAKGTLTITVKKTGGGTTVMTLTGMKRGAVKRELGDAPHVRRITFVHEGPMSSSPLSVV